MKILTKKLVSKTFRLGVAVKFLIGIFEFLAGLAFALSGKAILNSFIIFLAQQELQEDPSDFIINFLAKTSADFSVSTHVFTVVYLLFHGFINIFLAVSLLKNKMWAYFSAMAAFTVFIIYQLFRFFHTHSLLLLALTVFDIIVVIVVWLEYRNKFVKIIKDLESGA